MTFYNYTTLDDPSADSTYGGFWRRQRRSRELEYYRPRRRHVTADVADDAAARMSATNFSRAADQVIE